MNRAVADGTAGIRTLKKFLVETKGHGCSMCARVNWEGKKIPIEIDHIDGNWLNNDLSNLRLLCPNCHALTPTYKNKNKGNGRSYRRNRPSNSAEEYRTCNAATVVQVHSGAPFNG